jgi:hypothetical protein
LSLSGLKSIEAACDLYFPYIEGICVVGLIEARQKITDQGCPICGRKPESYIQRLVQG